MQIMKTMIFICCLSLLGCPTTVSVVLTNETNNQIVIVSQYSGKELSKINSGETKKIDYNFECFKVKSEGVIHDFQPEIPPDNYFKTDSLDSLIYAKFTAVKKLYLYRKNDGTSALIELKQGCAKYKKDA